MKKITQWWINLIFAFLFALLLFKAVWFVNVEEQYLLSYLEDDAYYYFEIARNFVQTGRMTFDGFTLTNGFHPLWLFLLLPFFALIQDPILVLRAVGLFCVLLTGVAGYLGLRYLSRYSLLAFSLGSIILFYSMFSFGFTGMETPLLLLMLTISLLLAEKLALGQSSPPQQSTVIGLSISLGLALLSRLDSIWLIGMLLGFFMLFYIRSNPKMWLTIAAGPALALLVFLSVNGYFFGNLMPVSGAAKSLNHQLLQFNSLFYEQLIYRAPSYYNIWPLYVPSFLFSVIYLLVLGIGMLKAKSIQLMKENYIPLSVASGFIIFTVYQLFRSSWALWAWYGYYLFLLAIFVFPYAVDVLISKLSAYMAFSRVLNGIAVVFSLMLGFQIVVGSMNLQFWSIEGASDFRYTNYQLAQKLNTSLPDSTIIAMGDRAGSFGYFFNGHVLQLEGLVGDYQLLDALRTNTLSEYMDAFDVEYLVTYHHPPSQYKTGWTLLTPYPHFSIGPKAEIVLCGEPEFRLENQEDTAYLWRWPSCPVE